ncbi:MAG: glycoside hydrolase family 5 protein [Paludibacteraceae bacterium]|nr:glycoside hydrolase family 5 protein [Paludibacteraceae bacterium]
MGFTKTMKAMATLAVSLLFSANAVFAGEQNQNDEMSNGMKQQPSTTLRSATSYPEGSPVFHNGKLSVSGTQMVNECGKAIQLRGMSSHGLAWTPAAYTEESITALVNEWNIDLFRIAVYTHEWGGYCMTGGQQWKTPEEFNIYIDALVSTKK